MIIPMDKLLIYKENRYILARAAMNAVDKIGNIKDYPEGQIKWKVVPNILKLILDEKLHIDLANYKKEEE